MKQNHTITNRMLVESSSLDLAESAAAEYPQRINGFEVHSEDKAHLQEFLFSLRKYRVMIISITLLCTALVAVYVASQPDLYEARAQVQVDLENTNANLTATKGGTFAVNPVNDPAYFNTQLQVLTSPRLLRQVVKDLDLEHDSNFPLRRSSLSPLRLQGLFGKQTSVDDKPATADQSIDRANDDISKEDLAEASRLAPHVEAIKANLKVEPVKEIRLPIKETRLIDLTYSHPNPQLAAKVVNAIVDTFVLSNLKRKTGNNKVTGDVLQQRVSELQTQIKGKENQLLDYAKNHQILSLDANQNMVVDRLVNLNRQLLEAENERKVAEAAHQAALTPGAADALASGSAREANEIETRLSQLRQRRSQLMVEFTPAWPEVREIDSQIAALERQSKQMRSRASAVVMTNLSTQYRQALARERALRGAYNQQRAETLTQNEAAVNYRILQQEIETNRGLLEGMLQRSKENEAALAALRNNIHVNDYAIIPKVPVGPRRFLITGVAFALALGLGVGVAVFRGYVDDSVRSTEDLKRTLHLHPLAAIPALRGKGRLLSGPAVFLEPNGNGRRHQELVIDADASAPFMEAYRHLRTPLLLSARRGEMKSLLVTSSMPGEGKTTTAVNTALSLARTGALVLVIDADLRKPRLHTIFQLANENGLTTLLPNNFDERDPLRFIEQHDRRLSMLTSGPIFPDSAELLGSDQMRKIIAALKGIYDYVIIDSPPIAYFTDAVLLSTLVDQVLLVVDTGKSTRASVRQSCQSLQAAGAKTFGIVLNNQKESKNGFKYPVDYSAYR